MDTMLHGLSWILLMTGCAFAVTGGIGLLRLPDFFSRTHAGGMTDTMGAGLVLTGLMFESGLNLATFKLVLILIFLYVTSATSAHAVAQAALARGVEPLLAEPDEEDPPSST